MTPPSTPVALLLLALILVHGWYDPACCSGVDCEPLAEAPKVEGDDLRLPNGVLFPRDQVRPSRDAGWHWCHGEGSIRGAHGSTPWARVYCVYQPPSA